MTNETEKLQESVNAAIEDQVAHQLSADMGFAFFQMIHMQAAQTGADEGIPPPKLAVAGTSYAVVYQYLLVKRISPAIAARFREQVCNSFDLADHDPTGFELETGGRVTLDDVSVMLPEGFNG